MAEDGDALRPLAKGAFFMSMQENKEKQENQVRQEQLAQEKDLSKRKVSIKQRFSAKRLALMAVFVALSYVVSFLEIPLPIMGAGFLKLDFGNVFIVLISFLLGPVEGIVVCLLKESLRLIGSQTIAGEIANFLVTSAYILLPSVLYQYRKNLKAVVISLLFGCLIATGAALIANRWIIFPAYAELGDGTVFGMPVPQAFKAMWIALLIFNLIKTVSVGILTMLLYKRLSNFLKKMKI